MAPNTVKKRRNTPKNKQTKTNIIFDEKRRKEYLTGFSKRKNERRKKFEEKIKLEIKTERKRLQNELRATIQKKAIGKGLTGLEHLVETKASVIELPDHTVTIEPLLGSNAQVDNSLLGNSEEVIEITEEERLTLADKKRKLKEINREANKKLKKTKAYKCQTKMVRDKSRKKSKSKSKSRSKSKSTPKSKQKRK